MKPFHMLYSKVPSKISKVSSLYLKLRSRFTLNFFLLVLLPYMIVSTAAYFHTRSLIEKNTYDAAIASISQEKNSIEKYIDELKLSVDIAADDLEPKALNSVNGTGGVENLSLQLRNAIEENLTPGQLQSLSAAYLIYSSEKQASYGPDADTATISSPATQQWFYDTVNDPAAVHVLGTMQRFYAEGKSKAVFCMAKSLSSPVDVNSQAVLLFDFDYSLFTDFTGSAALAENTAAERLIIDFEGNVLFSREQGKLTTAADEAVQEAVGNVDKGFRRIIYKNRSYYMSYVRYSGLNWTFVDLNPVSNVSENLWLSSPFMIICIITLPVILFVYLAVSLRLLSPINELTAVISDYENQLPGISVQTPLLRNRLPHAGVNGTSDLDLLINKIYSIKLRQKEAELNSLQNQINPHFLYNTLESIRGAALYHGIHDIAAMSKALSLLFRYSISDRVLVSIKEELQHLDNYLSIQNFRYENKFELLCSIPPELMDYKILKLTLQPLIENSIKHGLEMKLGKGTIKLEILALDNNIKIQISDDGLGMLPKKVEELNRSLAYDKYLQGSEGDRTGTGIGVKNVNSRIKLYFGGQYGLKFRDSLIGTTVEITLPAVMEN